MNNSIKKGRVRVVGIDIAKQSFQLHGVEKSGQIALRKKLSRVKLTPFIANLPPCIIGMEACGGAHHWYRVFTEMGHTVHLIALRFVKPFVKSNKNDAAEAEAIREAVQRPSMRFVPPKSVEQQDVQSLHRIRGRQVANRTRQSNQIRGLLLEYGIIIPKGIGKLRKRIPEILEDAESGLTPTFRKMLSELYDEIIHPDERIVSLEKKLELVSKQNEDCQLLLTIPGIGMLAATALVARVGNPWAFKSAREMAAWLGLVPRRHSTGGKPKLLGISEYSTA
uniref:Transposase n=2 Tax=Candidatus Kentrum eta TaxID=2126337 RepID=A0A450V7M7_9GAMM|nr:MAG: Transposase [Candidatus Kentron sp. H]